jgi:hypothetical protein
MKKTLMVLACFVLICPSATFAWNYIQMPKFNVFARENVRDQKSDELIPKVVDANGITVGYVLYNDVVGMNFNGQIVLVRMQNGYIEERELYFEDKSCSGKPYIIGANNYGFGWKNLVGFVNSNAIYVTNDTSCNQINVTVHSVLYSNGICGEISGEENYILQGSHRLDLPKPFVAPYRIKYDAQLELSPMEWWNFTLNSLLR